MKPLDKRYSLLQAAVPTGSIWNHVARMLEGMNQVQEQLA